MDLSITAWSVTAPRRLVKARKELSMVGPRRITYVASERLAKVRYLSLF